ncbi:energy-dependent translational throttle protein EttA [Streptomyces sp. NPDC057697]|uniref:energy-dependent translational throttle protein EttA n=1 Tax=Streptomyces sp. NPDC057697 TaxID=3346219 RepID=UPI00367E916F
MYVYTMRGARLARGDKVVLDDVTLTVPSGAKIGVVGPNGAGKSTVLRTMAGLERPVAGDAFPAPGTGVGILEQEPPLDDGATVRGNVENGVAGVRAGLRRYEEITTRLADADAGDERSGHLLDELGELQEELDRSGAWDLESRLEQAMDALGCPPPDTPVRELSGGERRRVALCGLLLSRPDLLLLDEPTNHLDVESVAWLEQHLADYPGTVVAVTHDRYFLDGVAQWILEIDRGRARAYEGNYATYLETKAARLKVEGHRDAKRQKRLADELQWIRSGTRGGRTPSRARLRRYEELAAEADRAHGPDSEEIRIPPGPRLGGLVLEAEHLTKGYGDRALWEDVSFSLPRGGIVGVLGPNGVGKSTLFRMICGQEPPDSGLLRLGETVRLSYVDQARAGLDGTRSVWEAVSEGLDHIRVGPVEMPSRAYVATFGFRGADQQKPVDALSGGERNRLNLALTLKQGGNLLLLDEPTNDLDTETLASLETALLGFPGCAVVAAHDRWFLDRTATHLLAWEGGATWFWFEGNYADYEANRAERLGTDAARPRRGTHRRLARD